MKKDLVLVGDKVLIEPRDGDDKTGAGLYLPQGIKDKDKAQAGLIVKTGPGYPVPDPSMLDQEPWARKSKDKYFPLQAREGDYCIFMRDHGVEIEVDNKKYIVVPHSAILLLIREDSHIPIKEF